MLGMEDENHPSYLNIGGQITEHVLETEILRAYGTWDFSIKKRSVI